MQISSFMLRQKPFDALILVGADSVKESICGKAGLKHGLRYCGTPNCDGPELLHDLKTKHLDTLHFVKQVYC